MSLWSASCLTVLRFKFIFSDKYNCCGCFKHFFIFFITLKFQCSIFFQNKILNYTRRLSNTNPLFTAWWLFFEGFCSFSHEYLQANGGKRHLSSEDQRNRFSIHRMKKVQNDHKALLLNRTKERKREKDGFRECKWQIFIN